MVPVFGFYRNIARRNGLSSICVECARAWGKILGERRRLDAIERLGGRCVGPECDVEGGNADPRVLQFDHVNGNGNAARAAKGDPARAVLKGDVDGLQLLCANCNWRKKVARDETVGDRVYSRAQAQRIAGPGKGSHPNTKKAAADWWAAASEADKAARNERMGRAKRRFTDEEEEEIRRRFLAGERQTALATELGCSLPLISNICRRSGTTRQQETP